MDSAFRGRRIALGFLPAGSGVEGWSRARSIPNPTPCSSLCQAVEDFIPPLWRRPHARTPVASILTTRQSGNHPGRPTAPHETGNARFHAPFGHLADVRRVQYTHHDCIHVSLPAMPVERPPQHDATGETPGDSPRTPPATDGVAGVPAELGSRTGSLPRGLYRRLCPGAAGAPAAAVAQAHRERESPRERSVRIVTAEGGTDTRIVPSVPTAPATATTLDDPWKPRRPSGLAQRQALPLGAKCKG